MRDRILTAIAEPHGYNKSIRIFCKSMVVYTALKMIVSWPVALLTMVYQPPVIPKNIILKIALSPSIFATSHINLFYGICLGFLVLAFFVRWTASVSILFFILAVNLWWINLSIVNGSDLILVMMSFWTLWINTEPTPRDSTSRSLTGFAIIMLQLQIVAIYFASGWDKLMSEVWRSGDALSYILHLDFMVTPSLYGKEYGEYTRLIFGWGTILFQLSFSVLVWFSRTRLLMLLFGVAFHLLIWVFLNLPDFSLLMIIAYLIFLKDEDYERVEDTLRSWREKWISYR